MHRGRRGRSTDPRTACLRASGRARWPNAAAARRRSGSCGRRRFDGGVRVSAVTLVGGACCGASVAHGGGCLGNVDRSWAFSVAMHAFTARCTEIRGPAQKGCAVCWTNACREHSVNDVLSEGSVLAGYRVVSLLGSGGMGSVYLADHPDSAALRRAEGPLRRAVPRPRLPRPLPARGRGGGPSITRTSSPSTTAARPTTIELWIAMQYVDGTDAEAAIESGTHDPAPGRPHRRPRWPRASTTHTPATSCTATSSPRTSCSRAHPAPTSESCWETSALPARSTTSG